MNKTNLLRRIIQTTSIASVLSIGCLVSSVEAAILCFTITGDTGSSSNYDGNWIFDVTLDTSVDPNQVILEIIKGNNDANTNEYKGTKYSYDATPNGDGTYNFGGSDFGMPAPNSLYDLSMMGTFDPSTDSLTITNPVTSQQVLPDDPDQPESEENPISNTNVYKFNFKVKSTPEPSATVGLLGLGILGTASTLKRKKKKELDKVS